MVQRRQAPPSAAELLRAEGNVLFAKGKWAAASERYTEAITMDPTITAMYVNRAMCTKKRGGDWARVVEDASTALAQQGGNMKALYLLGVALREQGQLGEAIRPLTRALEAAREQGDSIKDEELARAQYALWQLENMQRAEQRQGLCATLAELLAAQEAREREAAAAAAGAGALAAMVVRQPPLPQQQQQQQQQGQQRKEAQQPGQREQRGAQVAARYAALRQQLDEVFAAAGQRDALREVPSAFTCPLTMEVFRDPVIAGSSGCSYERTALLEHLAKVGPFDPVTQCALTAAEVRPNVWLRAAVAAYLEEHPWAWAECV